MGVAPTGGGVIVYPTRKKIFKLVYTGRNLFCSLPRSFYIFLPNDNGCFIMCENIQIRPTFLFV